MMDSNISYVTNSVVTTDTTHSSLREDEYVGDHGLVPDEWEINYEDLVIERELGTGSFGKVLKGSYFGTPVAIKQLLNPEDKMIKKYIQRELAAFKNIHHPNIVQFMGVSKYKGNIFIITEFIPGGDLTSLLSDPNVKFTWKTLCNVAFESAQAMTYLHARKIIHRDLKCSNLLVGDNWHIKVCDLGMARKTRSARMMAMTICGTDEYMAPEVILGEEYNDKADVFSFGMCLYEMITRKIPVERAPKDGYSFQAADFHSSVPKSAPPLFVQLMLSCVQYEPSLRPSFREILEAMKLIMKQPDITDTFIDYNGTPFFVKHYKVLAANNSIPAQNTTATNPSNNINNNNKTHTPPSQRPSGKLTETELREMIGDTDVDEVLQQLDALELERSRISPRDQQTSPRNAGMEIPPSRSPPQLPSDTDDQPPPLPPPRAVAPRKPTHPAPPVPQQQPPQSSPTRSASVSSSSSSSSSSFSSSAPSPARSPSNSESPKPQLQLPIHSLPQQQQQQQSPRNNASSPSTPSPASSPRSPHVSPRHSLQRSNTQPTISSRPTSSSSSTIVKEAQSAIVPGATTTTAATPAPASPRVQFQSDKTDDDTGVKNMPVYRRNTLGSVSRHHSPSVLLNSGSRTSGTVVSTPLHEAASKGDVEKVKEILALNPEIDVDELDRLGETPLFLAVKYSHIEVAEVLLTHPNMQSVNMPNNAGTYPVHLAIKNSNIKMVELLLSHDAKLKIPDANRNYPLHIACEMGNIAMVEKLVKLGGPTLLETINDKGETPLLQCCRLGHDPIIPVLIKAGASTKTTDRQGRTPLWYTARSGQTTLVEEMIKAGAEVDIVAEDETTALFHAAKEGHLGTAVLLVRSGANPGRYRKHSLGNSAEFRKALFDAVPKPEGTGSKLSN